MEPVIFGDLFFSRCYPLVPITPGGRREIRDLNDGSSFIWKLDWFGWFLSRPQLLLLNVTLAVLRLFTGLIAVWLASFRAFWPPLYAFVAGCTFCPFHKNRNAAIFVGKLACVTCFTKWGWNFEVFALGLLLHIIFCEVVSLWCDCLRFRHFSSLHPGSETEILDLPLHVYSGSWLLRRFCSCSCRFVVRCLFFAVCLFAGLVVGALRLFF